MTRRKDKNGRVLHKGEGERPNGTYYYRYKVPYTTKWKYIYAKKLNELREKESILEEILHEGLTYDGLHVTVAEQVDRYVTLHKWAKAGTLNAVTSIVRRIKQYPIAQQKIHDVRISECKAWFKELSAGGLSRGTIASFQNILRPAFEMAVEDSYIKRNPFHFKLGSIIANDAETREALTPKQQKLYLEFLATQGGRWHDVAVILIDTGMRAGELCGLTMQDIDFKLRRIHVSRQISYTKEGLKIETPKTKSGDRYIPMTSRAYQTLKKVLRERRDTTVEPSLDGICGFLFLSNNGNPIAPSNLCSGFERMTKKLTKEHNDFPHVTPHVLRHTFCTNAQRSNMNIKSLQYFMGHSTTAMTLDLYSHADLDSAHHEFQKAFGEV